MITTITLTITHKKPIIDLLDKVAGRTYTLDGVDDVTATTDAGWLPIESAPKDGTTVLTFRVLNGEPQITDARYFNGTATWGQRSWRYPEHDGPTNWMPLPLHHDQYR